jgi:hypothetical protein
LSAGFDPGSANRRLQKTYTPVNLASVGDADKARPLGRAKLRAVGTVESVTDIDSAIAHLRAKG